MGVEAVAAAGWSCMSFRIVNGAARLLVTRTLNEVHPMEGAERSPKADDYAASASPALGPTHDGSPDPASGESATLTLDVLASRIDGMGKWAQATQQQIRQLLLQASANDHLHSHLQDLQQAQEILAARLAEIDAVATDQVVDPVIGYHPLPEQQAQLFSALAEWQSTAKSLEKGRVAEMSTRTGGTATYRYVDIADVSEVARSAGAAGLGHFHRELSISGRSFIRTYLVHKAGGFISCDVPLSIRENSLTSAIQQWGAASTYARRYGLFLILGIAAGDEDDDGASLRTASTASGPRRGSEPVSRPARPVNTSPIRQPGP